MNLDRPLLPVHPSNKAAWDVAYAHIITLAVIVLRRVNPRATDRLVLSYLRHSTLRDMIDEASILEPAMTTLIVHGLLRNVADDVAR